MSKTEDKKNLAIRSNIWLLKFTRNWLRVALVVVGIYITLPFAAPTLMKIGAEGPARVIYTVYGALCHQFAFRSFFLYGEQAVYPRTNTGTNLKPFESYAVDITDFDEVADLYGFDISLMFTARDFIGTEQMGYKVALCERDIFIWIAIFTGGLIYGRVRKRLRPVPLWLYIILGAAPIALDGFSQLFGYPPFEWWPARETLPIFRAGTGALFGLMNVWLGFPYIEMSMRDTQAELEYKLSQAGVKV